MIVNITLVVVVSNFVEEKDRAFRDCAFQVVADRA